MITYSHEKFIEQAINGVLMQECNFEVELIIANDCSPDKTDEVIQKVIDNHHKPSWIRYIKHDKNLGMMSNFIFAMQQCKGKYIALCEGDDYWTDPLKLQKQVDFLEGNKEYDIVWSKFNKVDFKGCLIEENIPIFDESLADVTVDNFFETYRTWTLTSMFRATVVKKKDFSKFEYMKDNTLYFLILKNAQGRVLDFNSACYRIHDDGFWSSGSKLGNHIADYNNYNEINNIIINTKSLKIIIRHNLKSILKHLIGHDNCKIVEMRIYNNMFLPVILQLNWIEKLRFLKWYFIKISNKFIVP